MTLVGLGEMSVGLLQPGPMRRLAEVLLEHDSSTDQELEEYCMSVYWEVVAAAWYQFRTTSQVHNSHRQEQLC